MFDKGEITVTAGRGGDGMISFRREKFVPLGGPDGGDGGDGGDVIIRVEKNITSLISFQHRSIYRAGDGGNGGSRKKHGRDGNDLVLAVPVGVMVYSKTQIGDDVEICDLTEPNQRVVVARGGCGGLGNTHFATSTNQAPQIAQKGEAGEQKELILELKLIADVGIIGYPNAGKSSLLASASAARPKVASYPFTTLEPVLGFVEVGQQPLFVPLADLRRARGARRLRGAPRPRAARPARRSAPRGGRLHGPAGLEARVREGGPLPRPRRRGRR